MTKQDYDRMAASRSWTSLLESIPVGKTTTVDFPDTDGLKVIKAMAYAPYGKLSNFRFLFSAEGKRAKILKTVRNGL